ncbi:hypothetical protein PTKIN_Ptkin08bG0074400 [Pterospermum kingtungense]
MCRRCGVIGHRNPHCPFPNPEIERMLKSQMEYVRYRRRTTGVSVRRRAQNVDMENALLENANNMGVGPMDMENPMINENPHQEERQQEPT